MSIRRTEEGGQSHVILVGECCSGGRNLVYYFNLFQSYFLLNYLQFITFISVLLLSTYRTEEHGRKEFRERDTDQDREREKERRQREKERLKRRDEERQRRRERLDAENSCRKQEDEVRKERERNVDKKKCENLGDTSEKVMKSAKEERKDEKRERLRNKVRTTAFQLISPCTCPKLFLSSLQDRPAIQLYQPGARSRNRTTGAGPESATRKPDAETEKVSDKADD